MIPCILSLLLIIAVVSIALYVYRDERRGAADPDKETPPKSWNPDLPPCARVGHDWYIPEGRRSGYCLACGAPMDYKPHTEPRRRATVRDL